MSPLASPSSRPDAGRPALHGADAAPELGTAGLAAVRPDGPTSEEQLGARRAALSTLGWVGERVKLCGGALTALVVICIYLAITQSTFLTEANIFNVFTSNADLFLVSVGMTFVLLSGGFDLSVGPMVALTGLVIYGALVVGMPIGVAILLALGAGFVLGGLTNGLLIGKSKLNFFVITLGTSSIISGFVELVTNNQTKVVTAQGIMAAIGNGKLWGVPDPVWICLVVAVLAEAILGQTPFGRAVYAVGGNRDAARLAGINVALALILVYAISGLCAGVAGVVDVSRLGAAAPTTGSTLPLTSGAAVLLGGTSFSGGIGGIFGTVVGVLLISVLGNGLDLIGVSSFWQGIVTGAVLIAAVALDRIQHRAR